MSLPLLIFLAIIFYTLWEILASRAGGKIDANLSSTIFNILGAIIPLAAYLIIKLKGIKLIEASPSGIIYSLLAGVAIAIFSIILVKIFEKGGDVTYVIPVVYGGSIALASLIGWILFKESVSLLQAIGIGVIIMGIALIVIAKYKILTT